MFENNILIFNLGGDSDGKEIEGHDDVRAIEKDLKSKGIQLIQETVGGEKGPAHFVITDPDGYTILVDQHI